MNKQRLNVFKPGGPGVHGAQTGFTLPEVLVGMSILVVIISIATGVFLSTSRNQAHIQAENMLRGQAQTSLFRLAGKMNQTRMVMGNDTLGNNYRTHIEWTNTPTPLPSPLTALPTIRPQGSLAPEKTCDNSPTNFFRANTVGNSLLFGRYIGKFSAFGLGNTPSDVQKQRSLDIYEFKFIYVSDQPTAGSWFLDRSNTSSPTMRRRKIVEWTSMKYVDYDQFLDYLSDSAAADRSNIRSRLTSAGITHAWRRSGTNYNSDVFYAVAKADTSATVDSVSEHTIRKRGHINFMNFDKDVYSVAYNRQPNKAAADYHPLLNQVPYFYAPAPPACGGELPAPNTTPALSTGFPGGFEVMVVGPPSGRNVLIRLTHVALINGNRMIDHADTITAYARDL